MQTFVLRARRLAPVLVALVGMSLAVCPVHGGEQHAASARPTGESWPNFRNGNAQAGVAGSTLPEKLEPLWTFKAGKADSMIQSTVAIVGDRVYAASLNGKVFCLDRKTGEPIWTYRSKDDPDPEAYIPGFKAAVAVHEDLVFVGDEEGTFHAIERDSGKQKWKFETGAQIVSCASFYNGQVLFGSHDNSLYCLALADGSKAWQYATEGMVNCSPAISGDYTFITGCDSHLRVIDVRTGKQHTEMPLGTYLIASPTVIENMLYVGTHGGEVLAVDWKSQETVWTYKAPQGEFPPFHSSTAVNDDYVVVGGQDKRLHCIDRRTGDPVWKFDTKGHVDSSPVIVGERVFVGSSDGNVYGIDLKSGKETWRHTDGRPFTASPAVGEGCLVIGSESRTGNVYCFGAGQATAK